LLNVFDFQPVAMMDLYGSMTYAEINNELERKGEAEAVNLVKQLGKITARESHCVQQRLARQLAAQPLSTQGKPIHGYLLFQEHVPAIPAYRAVFDALDNVPEQKEARPKQSSAVPDTQYGRIQPHAPGQLVVHPVLNLAHFARSIRWHVQTLEECMMRVSGALGLESHRGDDGGLWVGKRKIATVGVSVSDWITTFGFAFNICNDIAPIRTPLNGRRADPSQGVTSVSLELARTVRVADVLPLFRACFEDASGATLVTGEEDAVPALGKAIPDREDSHPLRVES